MPRNDMGRPIRELLADPEWVAARIAGRGERERQFAEREAEYTHVEAEMVRELNEAGVRVSTVWDLVSRRTAYPEAIPVLLDHLPRPYPSRIREGIVRALAAPEANVGWRQLVDAFKNERATDPKFALAIAVGGASSDADISELADLVRHHAEGVVRVPLLWGLMKSSDPRAAKVLKEMQRDPDLAPQVKQARRERPPRSK